MNLVTKFDVINFNELNINERPNPLLDQSFSYRIVNVATPFLLMYAPAGLVVSVGMGLSKIYTDLTALIHAGKARDWDRCANSLGQVVLTISSVAGSILIPKLGALISHGSKFYVEMDWALTTVLKGNLQDSGLALLRAAHEIIYLGSIFVTTPELIALSLLAQAVLEAYQATTHFKSGNYLEAFGNIGLALIRSYRSIPHLDKVLLNHYGANLTQEKFDKLIKELKAQNPTNSDDNVDVASILTMKRYSNNIQGVSLDRLDLKNFRFNNMSFKDCSFVETSLENARITNVNFNNCLFKRANLINSIFSNTCFFDCSMKESLWNLSKLSNVSWINCNFSGAIFNDAVLEKVVFNFCKMFETSFLSAHVQKSIFSESDLTDCLLFHAKKDFIITGGTPHNFTRPVVGMLWDFKHHGAYATQTATLLKKDFNALLLKIEYSLEDIDSQTLEKEVNESLGIIQKNPLKGRDLSIAQALFQNAAEGSEIKRIQDKAKEAIQSINALWIPGGEDIHPKFYGKEIHNESNADDDSRRTMVELAMIQESRNNNIFTLGVCRGSQILNVQAGGTLIQNVDDHWGEVHELKLTANVKTKPLEIMQSILGSEGKIYGFSMHHQANDVIGERFTKVLDEEGSTEAIVSHDGNAIGVQFHPESYEYLRMKGLDDSFWKPNRNFFSYFLKRAQEYRSTKDGSMVA